MLADKWRSEQGTHPSGVSCEANISCRPNQIVGNTKCEDVDEEMAGEERNGIPTDQQQADRSICLWIAGFGGQPFCDGVRYSSHVGSPDVVHGCWSFLGIEPPKHMTSFVEQAYVFWDLKLFITILHVFVGGRWPLLLEKYHDCG